MDELGAFPNHTKSLLKSKCETMLLSSWLTEETKADWEKLLEKIESCNDFSNDDNIKKHFTDIEIKFLRHLIKWNGIPSPELKKRNK